MAVMRRASAPPRLASERTMEDAATQTRRHAQRLPGLPGITAAQADRIVPTQQLHQAQLRNIEQHNLRQQTELDFLVSRVNDMQQQILQLQAQLLNLMRSESSLAPPAAPRAGRRLR